ncbi:MAG: EF-P beta-lysylation protein EpmB [Halioglobus sp.]|nr:EF-P beta-lysylation protein EpmB [Halioglobus sp.]
MTSNALPLRQRDDWQSQLRNVISSADRLLATLDLRPEDVGYTPQACADFPLKVPLAFARRMRMGDPQDPLLLQVLARKEELLVTGGFNRDPVGETGGANPAKGIIHKYHGRALLIVSSGCAVNCRYCFRRHFPYSDNQNSRDEWREALAYIAQDPGISEVILSGGDPLVATDAYLAELVALIAAIPHVRRLRIHSRLPVVIPDRVTAGLLDAVCHERLQTIMVVHCNHANELDAAVDAAMAMFRHRGVTLLNQAVLLAGVNDSARALSDLSERLFVAGVLPYYLHLLDKVLGAAHFDVSEARAAELVAAITATLPGYLVPKLVREVAGAPSKLGVV